MSSPARERRRRRSRSVSPKYRDNTNRHPRSKSRSPHHRTRSRSNTRSRSRSPKRRSRSRSPTHLSSTRPGTNHKNSSRSRSRSRSKSRRKNRDRKTNKHLDKNGAKRSRSRSPSGTLRVMSYHICGPRFGLCSVCSDRILWRIDIGSLKKKVRKHRYYAPQFLFHCFCAVFVLTFWGFASYFLCLLFFVVIGCGFFGAPGSNIETMAYL